MGTKQYYSFLYYYGILCTHMHTWQVKCQAKYTIPDAPKANTPIDVQKQKEILAEGEYCPPLSADALKKHDLETSCELQQFRCPECYVFWWKTVPKYKPVSTCFQCRLCLNPLEHQEQFGVGRFTCRCGNVFFSKCQGSDVRTCNKCDHAVHKPYIHPLFKMDDFHRIPITVKQRYPSRNATSAPCGGHYYLPAGYVPQARPHDSFASGDTSVHLPQPRRCYHFSHLGDFIPSTFYNRGLHQPATRYPAAGNVSIMQMYPAYGSAEGINPGIATSSVYPSEAVTSASWNHNLPTYRPNTPPPGNIGGPESVGSTLHASSSHPVHVDLQSSQTRNPHRFTNPQENLPLPLSIVPPSQGQVCTSARTEDQSTTSLSESHPLSMDYIPPLTTAISSLAIDHDSLAGSEVSTDTLHDTGNTQSTQLASSSNCLPLLPPTNANLNTSQDELSPKASMNSTPTVSTTSLSVAKKPLSVAIASQLCVPENTVPLDYVPPLTTPIPSSTVDPLATSEHSLNSQNLIQPSLESGIPSVDVPVDLNMSETFIASSSGSEPTTEVGIDLLPRTNLSQTTTSDSSQPHVHLYSNLNSSQAEIDTGSTPNSSLTTTDSSAGLGALQTEANVSVNLNTSQETTSVTLNSSQITEANVSASLNLGVSPQALPVATTSPQSATTPQQASTTAQVSVDLNVSLTVTTSLSTTNSISTDTDSTSIRKARFFRNPRDLKYEQVSTRHDCTGSTESTIVPQLDDWSHVSKYKPHHRAYRRPRMPTYDFDHASNSCSSDEDM